MRRTGGQPACSRGRAVRDIGAHRVSEPQKRLRQSRPAWLMPTVLSVQSRVAYGHVGNAASVFPLQRLGIEAWALDTVAFSNHTGHGQWRGSVVPAATIAELFEGISALGVLPQIDAVLSGYLGDAMTGPLLLGIVERIRAANPRALFCCDPVIGDVDTGSYLTAGNPEFFRERP